MYTNGWSAQQLAEYLASVSAHNDARDAMRGAVELAAEAFEAEVGALMLDGELIVVVGFPVDCSPVEVIRSAAVSGADLEVPGAGTCPILAVSVELRGGEGTLLLARSCGGFNREEAGLLRAMARVLSLTLTNIDTLASLRERQHLLERLSKLQRAISLRVPLIEVFDAITAGAAELLGDDFVSLYLVDPADPETLRAASIFGMPRGVTLEKLRLRAGIGVTGRSFERNELVVVERYPDAPDSDRRAVRVGVQATMAAPVHEGGKVVGCLVVGSLSATRRYSNAERELLVAFAEHASLAATDAKTLEDLRLAVGDATHRAMHDPLTGLANRTRFLDRLSHALTVRRVNDLDVAVLYVDVDDFKLVNDRFGHGIGDQLLVHVAERLNDAVRTGDTVARLGGDEFAVLLERTAGAKEASRVGRRILASLCEPFDFGEVSLSCSASIGVAVRDSSTKSADDLLRNSDVAMYRAKNAGKRCLVMFEAEMYEALLARLELESDLRRLVGSDQIEVHFQPIVRLDDEKVVGVEALARWAHESRGFVPPTTFIPLAEETGLIVDLGRQILHRACSWVGDWQRSHPNSELFMSVNLSPAQLLDTGLIGAVEEELHEAGIGAGALVLEITESVFMQDTDVVTARLRQLRDLGVRLALDDFGTGYSSLGYLRRFPVDLLKIDRSFVNSLGGSNELQELTEAILALGSALGLRCVAEGVEDLRELKTLRQLGCEFAQGMYFGGPMPATVLESFLSGRPGDTGLDRVAVARRGAVAW